MKYQWQCLAFGVSTTESLEGAWSIATVNLSPFGKQQLVDFQIFKGRVCFIHHKCAAYLLQIEGMKSVSSRCEIWRVERRCHKETVNVRLSGKVKRERRRHEERVAALEAVQKTAQEQADLENEV